MIPDIYMLILIRTRFELRPQVYTAKCVKKMRFLKNGGKKFFGLKFCLEFKSEVKMNHLELEISSPSIVLGKSSRKCSKIGKLIQVFLYF